MTHEKFEGERTLMRIHIGESDKWHSKPLYEAIVEMLRKESFSGVTVCWQGWPFNATETSASSSPSSTSGPALLRLTFSFALTIASCSRMSTSSSIASMVKGGGA